MNSGKHNPYEILYNVSELKKKLIFGALFISSYEILKDNIINRVKNFFCFGDQVDDKYYSEVLSKDKNELQATLLWLKSMDAIDDSDIIIFHTIRNYRNDFSHRMMNYIFDEISIDSMEFDKLISVLDKIEKWWILNYEIAVDPSFDSDRDNISEKDIEAGSVLILKYIYDIAMNVKEGLEIRFN